MKVKILNNCGYTGIARVIGKVISAAPGEGGNCFVYGRDLIEAGAIEHRFFKSLPYAFRDYSIEIVEQASPDEEVISRAAANEMTLKALMSEALMSATLGEPDPFDDVFDGEI